MKRRNFLTISKENDLTPISAKNYNPILQLSKNEGGLDKFSGSWNSLSAGHLLRRTMFGVKPEDIKWSAQAGITETINKLFDPVDPPSPPLNIYEDDPDVAIGETWVNAPYRPLNEGKRIQSFRAWWTGVILNSGVSINEKMTLFWENHFSTETAIVRDSRFLYKKNSMLRNGALGNFKELAANITIDPAMLVYLNGDKNIIGRPNENYARELFELFTIGKGPIIGPGNYTNYSEHDIIEAAKVLTGWILDRNNIKSSYLGLFHDKTDKNFSDIFNNKVIKNKDEREYLELINMIFDEEETARHIVRKLYRWFVYYLIDDDVEQNIIIPLADRLRQDNYVIVPTLKLLLESEHFYNINAVGCMIKNPIDFISGIYRQFDMKFPENNVIEQYRAWYNYAFAFGALQDMILGDPPGVAGWSAFYQVPQFNRIWINSVTMPTRVYVSDILSNGIGIRQGETQLYIDGVLFADKLDNPDNPDKLIDETVEFLLPFKITQKQHDYLKQALLADLPDYTWGEAWQDWENDTENELKKLIIQIKLLKFIKALLSMAEYQLS